MITQYYSASGRPWKGKRTFYLSEAASGGVPEAVLDSRETPGRLPEAVLGLPTKGVKNHKEKGKE